MLSSDAFWVKKCRSNVSRTNGQDIQKLNRKKRKGVCQRHTITIQKSNKSLEGLARNIQKFKEVRVLTKSKCAFLCNGRQVSWIHDY